MTTADIGRARAWHTSEAAARRARRRRRAERRLKAYGIIAILLAAAALVTLISTIVERTVSVLREHYLVLETTVEVEEDDLAALRDQASGFTPSLRGPVFDALFAAAPGEGELDRGARRELTQLLSQDAGLELGQMVRRNTGLIGETVAFPALLDDEVQMYLMGALGELEELDATGAIGIERGDEGMTLELSPGALGEARAALARARAEEAELALAEAARQQNAVAAMEARLEATEGAEARATLEERRAGYVEARDAARARAEALLEKARDPRSTFTLAPDDPSVLIETGGGWLKLTELGSGAARAIELVPLGDTGTAAEGEWRAVLMAWPEAERAVSDRHIAWLEEFAEAGALEARLNTRLLAASDSSNAELAGLWGALVGSFWTMMVTFAIAFPVGVLAAIYLEEFAPRNRLTDFIEVNINNLAAVPSIVFGLLGLAIFVSGIEFHVFGQTIAIGGFMPRSSPLAGGTVLALMTLPTIIIAGRAAIRAVPPSVREAALGLGASRLQTAAHHVLPLAMPGILTGAIIGMAQALGETAPLLLVGMNSFIQEPPDSPLAPANVLPTLIYQWNNNPERLFDGKTAAAISVLLIFLIAMNALAVLLRKRFERRW